jgi:endo-1,4-beta-mannosidase
MPFITCRAGKLYEGDNEFRFIGCNMYELAYLDTAVSAKMIKDAADEGFKVIRFWAFEPTEKDKLKEICAEVKKYDIKIIPVLADKWGYLQSYKIDNEWYKGGYRRNYIPYISGLASAFKDYEQILLWELINEPVTGSYEAFHLFTEDASACFKEANPNHLLSVGTVGGVGDKFGGEFSRFSLENFGKLYSIPALDAVSLHDYSYDASVFERIDMHYRLKGDYYKSKIFGKIDSFLSSISLSVEKLFLKKNKLISIPFTLRWLWEIYNIRQLSIAKELGKPVYLGEVGFKRHRGIDRKKILRLDIERKFRQNISGYLLWSFEAQGWSRDGHDYGFNKEDGFGDVIKLFKPDLEM